MKDVDPDGFVERQPNLRPASLAGLPDAAGKVPPPLSGPFTPSTSPQRHAHVTAPPLTMDPFTDMSVGMAAQLVPPEGFMAGNPSLPTGLRKMSVEGA